MFRERCASWPSIGSCGLRGAILACLLIFYAGSPQASIRSFYPVGEKAGGYVVFVCEVTSREVGATTEQTPGA